MSSYYGSEIEEWFTDVVDCWRARCHDLERQLANVEAFGQAPCGCRRGIFDYDLCLQHHTAIRSQAERYPRWDADRCAVPWEAARAVQRFLEWCGDRAEEAHGSERDAFGQAPCGCRRGIFDYDLCLQHHTAIRSQAERYPRWDADRCAVPWEAARAVQRFLEWCGDVE